MNTRIKLIFLLLSCYGMTIQNGLASYQDVPKEVFEKRFLSRGDGMTFKEHADYALINKVHRNHVVRYFSERLDRIRNAPAPVLTQEWINANDSKEFPTGIPSYYEPIRYQCMSQGGLRFLTSIDGVNYEISVLKGNGEILSAFNKNDLGPVSQLNVIEEDILECAGTFGIEKALKELGDNVLQEEAINLKFGPSVIKAFTYYSNNQKHENPNGVKIILSLFDEFLELPELGLKGEAIG